MGPWAIACPIRAADVQYKADETRRKARIDQRTRDRMSTFADPVDAVDRERRAPATRLESAKNAQPGESFAVDGITLRPAQMARPRNSPRIWAEGPATGQRRDLLRENNTFWAWAAVEVLCILRGTPGCCVTLRVPRHGERSATDLRGCGSRGW